MSDCGRVLYDSSISSSYSLIKSPLYCYHRPWAYVRACKPLKCFLSRLCISNTGVVLLSASEIPIILLFAVEKLYASITISQM